MKKFIFTLGLIALALNLTNCSQYEDVDSQIAPKGDFGIYASVSRTVNDGLNTAWEADDQINLFHAEAGTTNYLNDTPYLNSAGQPFVCEDASTGYFLGTLHGGELDAAKSYDWYAFYPYKSYTTTPANDNGGYAYIGGRSDAKQTQNGNNSMAHIGGENYPMAGYAKGVAATEQPALVFKHLANLVEFEVVNGLSEAITVSEIQLTAAEDIVGSYYINFADYEALKFTPSRTSYVASTATLAVAEGTAIEAGASAKFYMAVKPFTAASGSKLAVKVSASSASGLGAHEKEITLSSDAVFSAGEIKTLKINYNTPFVEAESETWNLVSSTNDATSGTYVIVAKQKNGTTIAYCTNTTSNAGPVQNTISVFDLTSESVETNGVPENARWTFSGNAANMVITNPEGKYLYNTSTNNGVRVGDTASAWVITVSANNEAAFNLQDTNQNRYLTLYTSATAANWRCYTSPYVWSSTADQNSEIYLYRLDSGEVTPDVPATPVLTVTESEVNVTAEGGVATIAYSVTNAVGGASVEASTEATWISDFDYTTAGEVKFTVAENTVEEARTATITLAYTGAESKIITVTQAAALPEVLNPVLDVLNRDFTGITESSYTDWSGKTGTSGAVYAGNSAGGNSSIQLRSDKNTAGIVTTATAGKVSRVTVVWNSNTAVDRTLDIYGKNTPYSEASELYGTDAGTKIGSLTNGGATTLNITGDYAYIGLRSASGAMYLSEIQVVWNDPEGTLKPAPILSVSPTAFNVDAEGGEQSATYSIENPIDGASLTATTEATWISNISLATAGQITFTVAENTGDAREATIIVAYPNVESQTITVSQAAKLADGGEPTTATLSFANKAQRTKFDTSQQVWEQNGIVFTNKKASSSNNVADYANPVRCYQNSSITITAPGKITKVVFTTDGSKYATALKSSIGESATVSGSTVTATFSNVDAVEIAKLTGQVRIKSIEVTYLQ